MLHFSWNFSIIFSMSPKTILENNSELKKVVNVKGKGKVHILYN